MLTYGSRILNDPGKLAASLPGIPLTGDGPVFAEPWQAQVFAMTVKLHENGVFSWPRWSDALAAEIAAAGPGDSADNYYMHWLNALEKLLDENNLISEQERLARKQAWDRAARATPHGQPIVLDDKS